MTSSEAANASSSQQLNRALNLGLYVQLELRIEWQLYTRHCEGDKLFLVHHAVGKNVKLGEDPIDSLWVNQDRTNLIYLILLLDAHFIGLFTEQSSHLFRIQVPGIFRVQLNPQLFRYIDCVRESN